MKRKCPLSKLSTFAMFIYIYNLRPDSFDLHYKSKPHTLAVSVDRSALPHPTLLTGYVWRDTYFVYSRIHYTRRAIGNALTMDFCQTLRISIVAFRDVQPTISTNQHTFMNLLTGWRTVLEQRPTKRPTIYGVDAMSKLVSLEHKLHNRIYWLPSHVNPSCNSAQQCQHSMVSHHHEDFRLILDYYA